MMGMQRFYSQKGFTLIELVVVTLVIAVIAGASIAAFNSGFVDEQEETATLYEMTQIRDAILQFQQDNPSFPLDGTRFCTPADASFLIKDEYASSPTTSPCNLDTAHTTWDPNYRLGWQGPYMTKVGNTLREISGNLEFDGGTAGAGSDIDNVNVLTDPYGDIGNPYLLFELDDNDRARVVSAGPDGIYDGNNLTDICSGNDDDLVVCLR